ncbi:MAG: hypothetical protein IKY94_14025 [Lachnospiraceae bacterium]|nr:hypothetical protein [Lachnospiraceae bacterium]
MPLEKQSLNNFLPEGFETLNQEGYKKNFSADKIKTGYEKDLKDRVSGPNFNNLIDVVGKNTNTLNSYVEYLNGMPINNVPTVNANGQLDYINNNFLNKNQITNCILEAPNDYFSITNTNITLKKGLKVLMPNGRNSDKTLKNLEFILENDISVGLVTGSNYQPRVVFLQENGMAAISKENIFYLHSLGELPETLPNTLQTHAYCELENKWFLSRTGTTTAQWEEFKECPIMEYQPRSDGKTPNTLTFSTLDILKRFDKFEVSGWGMPSNKYITLTLGANGSSYTAPANGWYYLKKQANGTNQSLSLQTPKMQVDADATVSGHYVGLIMPVTKGDVLSVYYTLGGSLSGFRFIYAEGEV